MLPMEPKLGKMIILGAIFNCLDPVLTIVAGLSVRDPFLAPLDKKDVRSSWVAKWLFLFVLIFFFYLLQFLFFFVLCGIFSLLIINAYPGIM